MNPLSPNRFVSPLDAFIGAEDGELSSGRILSAESIPDPYRGLLAHERDMTSTLEAYHHGRIHLRLIVYRVCDEIYMRLVVLELDGTRTPVEYGAIAIFLERFPAEVRAMIREAQLPLGRILAEQGISCRVRPIRYVKLAATAGMRRELRLADGSELYARRTVIERLDGVRLAEVLEVLPP